MEVFIENKDIISGSFNFLEYNEKEKKYYYETLILPFDKISGNGVLYNREKAISTMKENIGNALLWNHKTNGNWNESRPLGEWVDMYDKEDGVYGKAAIYNVSYTQELLEWLKVASKPRVSLNVSGSGKQRKTELGSPYMEAYIERWNECSFVSTPGFVQASGSFIMEMTESLNKFNKEYTNNLDKVNNLLDKYI